MQSTVCRTCLTECNSEKLMLIETNFTIRDIATNISKMISCCTGLELLESDEFPTQICDECLEKTIEAFKFRIKCWESNKYFLQSSKLRQEEELQVDEDFIIEYDGDVDQIESIEEILGQFAAPEDIKVEADISSQSDSRFVNDFKSDIVAESEPPSIPEKPKQYTPIIRRRKKGQPGQRKRNRKPTTFKCKYCPSIFQKSESRDIHVQYHESKACHICNLVCKTESVFRIHLKHHDPSSCHICELCGKSVPYRAKLVEHLRTHSGEKPYKCKLCDYSCAQTSTLVTHMRRHTGDRPFKCKFCPNRFYTSGDRTMHEKVHSGERPYACVVCSKTFVRRECWKDHMLTHNPKKEYRCSFCDKTFHRKDNFKIHQRIHTGEMPYSCEKCGKMFNQRHCYRSHMVRHHSDHS